MLATTADRSAGMHWLAAYACALRLSSIAVGMDIAGVSQWVVFSLCRLLSARAAYGLGLRVSGLQHVDDLLGLPIMR